MTYIFFLIILFAAQLIYFKIADKFNIIDKPNLRSSHTTTTLRGGGIIFFIAACLFFLFNKFEYPWFFMGLTLISLISFIDDIRALSSKLRLPFHFAAMMLMFYQWDLFNLPWYFTAIALILCTGILNAYNFMDGINGITGTYSIVILAALWYINSNIISFTNNEFIYIVALSLLVFNFFNFRKRAKCFAGDVGSMSIAFILIFMLGQLIIKTSDFNYVLLLAVYGVDTVLTIIHRIILKENILEAHRKHIYQLLSNELKIPQLIVSSIYAIIQLAIIVGLLVFKSNTYIYSSIVIIALILAYTLFKNKYYHLHQSK